MSQQSRDLDLGLCAEHTRSNEAYCEVCRSIVCPSCIMFGSHKGHSVLAPRQAAMYIREQIDQVNKAGKLSADYTGRILQDIRDTKFKAEQLQETVVSQIDAKFGALIQGLKKRREELKDSVIEHFEEELRKIQEEEARWEMREEVAKELLKITSEDDDQRLVRDCYELLRHVDGLNETIEFKTFNLLNSVDVSISSGTQLEYNHLVAELETIGSFGEKQQLQFRS